MSTEQEQYLQWVGAQTIAQQAAEQQEQEQRSRAANQSLRNQQIMADRNRSAQDRMIEAAQERQRQRDKEREKEQAQAQQAQAEQLEQATKAQALSEWLQAGGYASDFEKQWKQQYVIIQQERAASREVQAKERFMQRYGGF